MGGAEDSPIHHGSYQDQFKFWETLLEFLTQEAHGPFTPISDVVFTAERAGTLAVIDYAFSGRPYPELAKALAAVADDSLEHLDEHLPDVDPEKYARVRNGYIKIRDLK